MPRPPQPLPTPSEGLVYHCSNCNLVVPADAPADVPDADCAFVSLHRLAWYNPDETVAGQHCSAVATWALIHDLALRAAHPDAVDYIKAYKTDRKKHFRASAARKAMTDERVQRDCTYHIADPARLRKDVALYQDCHDCGDPATLVYLGDTPRYSCSRHHGDAPKE